jgi:hypothetical protein
LFKNKETRHPELDSGSVAMEYTPFKQIPNPPNWSGQEVTHDNCPHLTSPTGEEFGNSSFPVGKVGMGQIQNVIKTSWVLLNLGSWIDNYTFRQFQIRG